MSVAEEILILQDKWEGKSIKEKRKDITEIYQHLY